MRAFDRWPWMTLNGVIALILRYFTELDSFAGRFHVTVVEDRPILSAEYCLPLLAKTDARSLCYSWATCNDLVKTKLSAWSTIKKVWTWNAYEIMLRCGDFESQCSRKRWMSRQGSTQTSRETRSALSDP